MALTKPNDPAAPVNPAAFVAQAAPDQFDTDLLALALNATGVVSGCAVTQRGAGANMSVDVAAGTVEIAGQQIAVTGTNVAVTAAHASLDRIDIVVVSTAGAVTVTAGTANANPCDPPIPASSAVLAEVYVPAADTAINTNQITDKRAIIGLVSIANNMPTAATLLLSSRVTGDTNDRLQVQANGKLLWGPGNAVPDANLYWAGTGQLKTDSVLYVVGDVYARNTTGTQVGIGNVGPGGQSGIYFQNAEAGANIYRVSVGTMKIDGALRVGGGGAAESAGPYVDMGNLGDAVNVYFRAQGATNVGVILRAIGTGHVGLQTQNGAIIALDSDANGLVTAGYGLIVNNGLKLGSSFIVSDPSVHSDGDGIYYQTATTGGAHYFRYAGQTNNYMIAFSSEGNTKSTIYFYDGAGSTDVRLQRSAAGSAQFLLAPGNTTGTFLVKVPTAGSAAAAAVQAQGDSASVYIAATSSTYTPSGLILANQGILYADSTGGLLVSSISAADIVFSTGGFGATNERLRVVNSTGATQITQQTLGNEVQRLTSIATNDDPAEQVYQNRVATTDATQTTLHTVTLATGQTVLIEAYVTARRTGGTAGTAEDGAGYVIRGTYKNVAGTATLIAQLNLDYTAESVAAYDATFTVSGATVLVKVTGVASTNVTWHATVRVYRVGS